MIVDNQKIEVKITRRNIKTYSKNRDIKIGDTIFVDVGELTHGSHYKVDVKCDYCGKIVKVVYRDYCKYRYDKYSCASCRQRKTSEYNAPERIDSLFTRAKSFCDENGYVFLTNKSDIKNASSIVSYECPIHGVHKTKVYILVSKHGCIECANERSHNLSRKSVDNVINDFKKYGGKLLNPEEYINWNSKNLKTICKLCGNTFTTSYCAFMRHSGQYCPDCSNTMSKGEWKVCNFLEKNHIDYKTQYRFQECRDRATLPFDFYIPNKNICIEYDGEGHYIPIKRGNRTDIEANHELKNIKKRDAIKTAYCSSHKIKLVRIPYWDFENIEQILENALFT